MDSSSEEQEAPRRRTVRRRATTERVPRRTVTRRSLSARREAAREAAREEAVQEEETTVSQRKAPTAIAHDSERSAQKKKQLLTLAIILVVGISASAGVGLLDKGQINVVETIEERNERIRNNQADERDTMTSLIEVPVQNTSERAADGGLVGRGTGGRTPEPVPEDTASSTDETASSTEAVASSTEDGVDEAVEETARPEDAPSETTEAVTQ